MENKISILHLVKAFNHGGVAAHVTDLSKELLNQGHYSIVASPFGTHLTNLKKNNIDHYKFNFSLINPFGFIKNLIKLIILIKDKEIDIVHCHNRSCAVYMQIITKLVDIPYIWSIHQENIPSNPLYKRFTFYGKKAVAPTKSLQKFLIEKMNIPQKNIRRITYGINLKEFKKISVNDTRFLKNKFDISNEKIITLLGRLEEIKGHKCLLSAIQKVDDKSNVKILFVGESKSDYKSELKKMIRDYNLKSNVIFTGYISAREVLSITDLMVLPSYKDGVTLAVLNSFAMKVPVIRTKTSGYYDVKNYCIGMDFDDSDFLAKEINMLLEGKDYTKMTTDAFNFVCSDYSLKKMINDSLEVYSESIKNT